MVTLPIVEDVVAVDKYLVSKEDIKEEPAHTKIENKRAIGTTITSGFHFHRERSLESVGSVHCIDTTTHSVVHSFAYFAGLE